MTESPELSRRDGSIFVRVSPEILERMKNGDVEPVVILGVQEQDDGTYDMTLMTTEVIHEHREMREAIRAIGSAWRGGEDAEIGTAIGHAADVARLREQQGS